MIKDSNGLYHVTGCLHMHTLDSDGTKTHQEVIEIGREVGLDFLIFTDHMTLRSRAKAESFHGDLLSIVGYEHNDPSDKNHFMILDSAEVYNVQYSVAEYVGLSKKDDALGIIAHPDETRSAEGEFPPYEWTDWSVTGYHGIELWNQMSEWMERLTASALPGKLRLLFSPRKFMNEPQPVILKRWDEINQKEKIVGVAGVDAHGFPYKLGPKILTIFPYKVHFRSLQNHLILDKPLAEDYQSARKQILDAIRAAQLYFSNNRWGDAAGFQFVARATDNLAYCGGEQVLSPDSHFEIQSPRRAQIHLIKDGEIVRQVNASQATFPINEPGVYRAEIYRRGKGWIYSNHIRISRAEPN